MTNIDERAEFEKWMFNNNPPYAAANRDAKGNYTWTRAAFAWDGWQARATLPTDEASEFRALVEAGCLLCASIVCAEAENAAERESV
jgi:hypothetical protein